MIAPSLCLPLQQVCEEFFGSADASFQLIYVAGHFFLSPRTMSPPGRSPVDVQAVDKLGRMALSQSESPIRTNYDFLIAGQGVQDFD